MPIRDREDAAEVQEHIDRIYGAESDERAAAIRRLFVEALDFNADQGQASLANPRTGVELPKNAERIAELEGVHVLYVALTAPENGRIRKADVSEAARLLANQLGDDLLLVFTNADAGQLHLVLPEQEGPRPTLRRMVVERDLLQRTAVQQISNIYWSYREKGSIRAALEEAFDVEPVTRRFFEEYKRVFEAAEESALGFGDGDEEQEARRLFIQTLFNRLMFVYFLSRKGWLTFKGEKDYLNALWHDYKGSPDQSNFYRDRLAHLFFSGLNSPRRQDGNGSVTNSLFGEVPYLNGGLFEEGDLDRRQGVTVLDETIEAVLTDLFARFNFTVMESTPFDIEVAVDPEMLGKVFEELVTGRHKSGSYYTPRPVVSFMCREALKGYLEARDTGLTSDVIAGFVDEYRTEAIDVAAARRVAGALSEVTVVDPACGSGAYLLGMMQELIELQTVLFNVGANAKSLHQLKLEIIDRNLRGVDIDPFAVHIAQLRLWLSLTIEDERALPEPLPNLDLNIVVGDSLLAAHEAEGGVQAALGDTTAELQELKSRYLRAAAGPSKASLRTQIAELNRGLRERFGGKGATDAGGGVEWRATFPEVFEERAERGGGFDVVIANPPYHQLESDGGRLANLYRDVGYRTFAPRGDIYQLFYERGCELLRPRTGILAYITSNSWLRTEYGSRLRRYFAERHTPLRWLDLGKDVFESAIVDSGVLLLRTGGGETTSFPAVDMDRQPGVAFPPSDNLWGRIRPDGGSPWSTLSLIEQSVMEKMRARGTPLRDWGVLVKRGIITGYNEAFIIDGATREALIAEDPASAEIIKPILRGRDIDRYLAKWAGKWLILAKFGSHEYLASDYPAVYRHLARHQKKLRSRGQVRYTRSRGKNRSGGYPGQHHWLELDNNPTDEFLGLFSQPKLFWAAMSPEGRFAYSERDEFCNQKGYILTGPSLKYLAAVLNSTLASWFMERTAFTTGMGLIQWERLTVAPIPVPKIHEERQHPFVQLVDRIIDSKMANTSANTEDWERAIDRLVYELYGLTADEATAIDGALGG
ncbi:MAG: Eco57I restriction-modification methylase domain-containing protein [Chloroflexi bacterium]|nr:Eco57I restriction-modification methylase domain-containing protein [Chloroflexota bacterium]